MDFTNQDELEKLIGYTFKDKRLLRLAMTHSSYGHEVMIHKSGPKDNERLEFLGDAVLELVTSVYLYKLYDTIPEGRLSKLRASLVCEPSLATCARRIRLNEFLLLGKGEKQNKGDERDSIISDAFEALIGAIYLDGGMEPASEFINRLVLDDIESKRLFYDAKTELQVIIQNKYQCVPLYETISEEGPPHDKHYTVSCIVNDVEYGRGTGNSKKSAQQKAAYNAIIRLKEEQE
ncbi:MAG: ribonuclease III [Lachnospiraceae bacterium]